MGGVSSARSSESAYRCGHRAVVGTNRESRLSSSIHAPSDLLVRRLVPVMDSPIAGEADLNFDTAAFAAIDADALVQVGITER